MSLQAEYEACMGKLDQMVVPYTDFDGTPMHHYEDGWEQVATRMGQIEELMDLREPINLMEWECIQYGCNATAEKIAEYHAYYTMEEPNQ